MKYIILLFLCSACYAELPAAKVSEIANAVYKIEGGAKTKYPYGIKSIKTSNPRRVCENTIRNNYARWQAAGSNGSYLNFLAARYCPPSADPTGHTNWVRNINKLVKL